MNPSDYPKELQDSIHLLTKYYGFTCDQLTTVTSPEFQKGFDQIQLNALYETLGAECTPPNRDEIIRTLQMLVVIVRSQPFSKHVYTADDLKEQMKRRDMLRLLVLCNTTRIGDTIIIKNRSRSFQLHNEVNWFIEELIKPNVNAVLGGMSYEDALSELENETSHHRGRRAKDPLMLNLIWGTYRLISDRCHFRTPMPNALCNFIIKLLQLMDILPENTEVDAFWIRAQLRYIASRKQNEQSCISLKE